MYLHASIMYVTMLTGKGLQVFGEDLSGLFISLFMLFKVSGSRHEDYGEFQRRLVLRVNKFLEYIESRWLTLAPAV